MDLIMSICVSVLLYSEQLVYMQANTHARPHPHIADLLKKDHVSSFGPVFPLYK